MKARPWAAPAWRWMCTGLLLLNIGCAASASAAGSPIVPIQELHAAPERYEGQRIRVVGYLQLEVDENVVYATREDFNNSVTEHALLLALTIPQRRSSSKLNHGHVVVEGVFRVKDNGHGATPIGSLQPVLRLQMWRKSRK